LTLGSQIDTDGYPDRYHSDIQIDIQIDVQIDIQIDHRYVSPDLCSNITPV
jgi:hypothetical protein